VFLLVQFLQLTSQDDSEESNLCTPPTAQQALAQLSKSDGGPLGTFNKNYMAFTMTEVLSNFKNLITHQPVNFSGAAIQLSSLPASSSAGSCSLTQSNFPFCNACSVVTDLGKHKFPRFINEIKCETESKPCGVNRIGYCKTATVTQTLLFWKCNSTTGQETLDVFNQEIRSCCECVLFQ